MMSDGFGLPDMGRSFVEVKEEVEEAALGRGLSSSFGVRPVGGPVNDSETEVRREGKRGGKRGGGGGDGGGRLLTVEPEAMVIIVLLPVGITVAGFGVVS